MARLDKDGRHWQTYSTASTNRGLPDDRVIALTFSADGVLWIGTWNGLRRLDKDGRWRKDSGLPDDTAVLALALGTDGTLWIGTYGGGLARLDKDGRWQSYRRINTKGGLPDDHVQALALSSDAALWIGNQSGGLARLDKDGLWQTYSTVSTKGGLPDDAVQVLATGADGALWIGTQSGGLARLDKAGAGRPTARLALMATCRTIASRRWQPARTVPSGSELKVAAWRGSTRTDGTGRPTARLEHFHDWRR